MKNFFQFNAKMNRIIIFLLVLSLMVGSLSACRKTPIDNTSSLIGSSSNNTSSNDDSSSDDTDSDENTSSDDEIDLDDDVSSDDEDNGDEIWVEELRVQNAGAPKSDSFMGGGSGIYSCYTFMNDYLGRNYSDLMAQIEFDRLQDMGIKRVRTMFKFNWAWDKNANTWNWESAEMKAVYRWISEMQKRGIDVMLNPWSFEYYVEGTGISDLPYLRVEGNFTESCNRFSDAVTELFRQMKARGYTNAKYFVLFTEPNKVLQEYNRISQYDKEYIQIAKAVHNKLTSAGLRKNIQIIGPNQSNVYNTTLLEKCIGEAGECFDILSTHSYILGTNLLTDTYADNTISQWTPYLDAMKKSGSKKSFWIDEYNVQDYTWTSKGYSNVGFDDSWRGTQQAVVFATGMNLGIDNMLLWTLSDQLWPNQLNSGNDSGFYSGELRHGLFQTMTTSMIPKAQYYSYSLMSKYFGNGGKTYYSASVEEYTGVYISTCNTNEGEWTVMVINCNYEPIKVNVNFDKALPGVKMFRHRYSPETVKPTTQAAIIDADKTYHNVKKGFSDLLAAGGVTVYTTIKG